MLHAFVLAALTFYWMSLDWEFGDEVVVARINQINRYLLLSNEDEEAADLKKDLFLLNCSYDKILVPYSDDNGSGMRAISDRKKLTEFLRIVNNTPTNTKVIVWDLFIDDASEYDSALFAEMHRAKNLLISSYQETDGVISKPVPGLSYALAQYSTTSDIFLKYHILQNDSTPYMPAAIYQRLHNERISSLGGFAWHHGLWQNSFIVDLPIRRAHMDQNEFPVWNLGELIDSFSEKEIQTMLQNKFIVVGDFYENDLHQTLLGTQPGPLIIVNSYLAILRGIPRISFLDFFFVFILYFAVTVYLFRLKTHRTRIAGNLYKKKAARFLLKYFTYIFIFAIYTFMVYLITRKHLQILIFAFYFNLLEFLLIKYQKRLPAWLTYYTRPSAPAETVVAENDGLPA